MLKIRGISIEKPYLYLQIDRPLPNVRLTSEPLLGAEFAQTSEAGRKLRDTRRVCLKWLLGESLQNYYSI